MNLTQGYFELEQLNRFMVNSLNLPNLLSEVKPIKIKGKDNNVIGNYIPVACVSSVLNKKALNMVQCEIITYIFDLNKISYIN